MSIRKRIADLLLQKSRGVHASREDEATGPDHPVDESLCKMSFSDVLALLQAEGSFAPGTTDDVLEAEVTRLRQAMTERGLSIRALSGRVKVSRRILNRLFSSPSPGVHIDTLATIAAALDTPLMGIESSTDSSASPREMTSTQANGDQATEWPPSSGVSPVEERVSTTSPRSPESSFFETYFGSQTKQVSHAATTETIQPPREERTSPRQPQTDSSRSRNHASSFEPLKESPLFQALNAGQEAWKPAAQASEGRAHAFATELSGHGQRIEKISTIGYAGGVAACLAARAFSKDSPAVALGVGGVGAVLLAAGRSAEADAPQTGRILKSVGTGMAVTTAMVWAAQGMARVLERHKRSGNGNSDA